MRRANQAPLVKNPRSHEIWSGVGKLAEQRYQSFPGLENISLVNPKTMTNVYEIFRTAKKNRIGGLAFTQHRSVGVPYAVCGSRLLRVKDG